MGGFVLTQRNALGTLSGDTLVLCFLVGVALYRCRTRIIWSPWLGAAAALAAMGLLMAQGAGDVLSAIPLAYLTVFLGLCNPPRARLIFGGDYSYGIFLYGFPIQQTVASAGPWAHHWYINLAVSLPIAATVAVSSWWLIEKPVLSRKHLLLKLEERALIVVRYWSERARRYDAQIRYLRYIRQRIPALR